MKRAARPGGGSARVLSLMMLITLAGKLLGVLRDRLQGAALGANTAEGIAFLQASRLPRDFLDICFAAAFSASFIPVFSGYLETKGKKAAFDLAAQFISVTLALTAAVTLLGVVAAGSLYDLFLNGGALPPDTRGLGVWLLRLMFPLLVLSGLAFSFSGMLHSLGEFNLPAAMSVVSNGIVVAYLLFFYERFGLNGLCAAYLLGWLGQAAVQAPFLAKRRFRFRFAFSLRDPGLRQVARLALPVTAASWLAPVNLLAAGKAAAMFGGPYDVAALQYANNLYVIAGGVLVLSVTNMVFPQLARQEAADDRAAFAETVRGTVHGLLFFLFPMAAGLLALALPAVRLVYLSGLFDERAAEVTASALFWFAPGLVGYGLQAALCRVCYACRDGKTPVLSAILGIALNAGLAFALAPRFQAAGIAAAGTAGITLAAAVLTVSLARRGLLSFDRAAWMALAKTAALTGLMLAAVLPCRAWVGALPDGMMARVIKIAAPMLLGAAVYLGGAWAWRVLPGRF